MATIKSGNWSFAEPPFEDGDVIESCNCSQLAPGTEICAGVRDLTINGGNFVNCKSQPTWTVNGGNWSQVSRCSHVHPEWIERGLPACKADCVHRDGAVKQWVSVDEKEYRGEKNSLSAEKPDVRIGKSVDPDDVTIQDFQKLVYVYRDTASAAVKHG